MAPCRAGRVNRPCTRPWPSSDMVNRAAASAGLPRPRAAGPRGPRRPRGRRPRGSGGPGSSTPSRRARRRRVIRWWRAASRTSGSTRSAGSASTASTITAAWSGSTRPSASASRTGSCSPSSADRELDLAVRRRPGLPGGHRPPRSRSWSPRPPSPAWIRSACATARSSSSATRAASRVISPSVSRVCAARHRPHRRLHQVRRARRGSGPPPPPPGAPSAHRRHPVERQRWWSWVQSSRDHRQFGAIVSVFEHEFETSWLCGPSAPQASRTSWPRMSRSGRPSPSLSSASGDDVRRCRHHS